MTTQPEGQTILPGRNAVFTVAVGGTGPFSYQWQFNGVNLPNNIITTVAGNGAGAFAGDGGAATNASLAYPQVVALDAGGGLYVVDTGNNRIRKVAASGLITTMAGNGAGAYTGDGGPATNASLNYPYGAAVDAAGNLFIADTYNNCIRKVAANGMIGTVAGNGGATYAGDGGPATNAGLYYPYGVTVDAAGNLYIADTYNSCIRKVAANGIITTVAGNGLQGYSGDGGPAIIAILDNPENVAVDAAGNLFIADCNNNCIRKVDTNGIITTVAGNGAYGYSGDDGQAAGASLAGPTGLALSASGNLFIADYNNQRIREVDASGLIATVAGNGSSSYAGDGGPATSAGLNYPTGAALDASGNLYIADNNNNRIRKVLLYAGYPTLTLNDAGATNAGNYTVIVTSPYGSVTSAVATLHVGVTEPQIIACDASFGFLTNHFGFNVSAAAGQAIVVDGSTDLVNWTPLCTNTVGVNPCYFCDTNWTNFARRFYRARLP
jgi:sugar lactone lactonase YvrE